MQVFFREFCGIFKNNLLYRTPLLAASDKFLHFQEKGKRNFKLRIQKDTCFFLNLTKSGHFRRLHLKLVFRTIGQNFS